MAGTQAGSAGGRLGAGHGGLDRVDRHSRVASLAPLAAGGLGLPGTDDLLVSVVGQDDKKRANFSAQLGVERTHRAPRVVLRGTRLGSSGTSVAR